MGMSEMKSLRELIMPEKLRVLNAHLWGNSAQCAYDKWYEELLTNINKLESSAVRMYHDIGGPWVPECDKENRLYDRTALLINIEELPKKVTRDEIEKFQVQVERDNVSCEEVNHLLTRILKEWE